jgi:hypothetical protein
MVDHLVTEAAVGGVTPLEVRCPDAATSRVLVEVQNSGNAGARRADSRREPNRANPRQYLCNGQRQPDWRDLAPGQVKTVEVTFTPPAAQDYSGTPTLTVTNLNTPKTMPLTGRGV